MAEPPKNIEWDEATTREIDWDESTTRDLAAAPAEITTPAPKRKVPVVSSAPVAALEALASLNPGYQALRSIGWAGPGVRTEGDPEVGALEHGLVNKPLSMLPAGNLLANLGATAALTGSRAVSAATPASALRRLSALPGVGQFAPAAGPGAVLTPEAQKELEAMGEAVPTEPGTPGAVDTYRRLRDARKERLRAGAEQHPTADTAGAAAGVALGALAPLPAFAPAGGAAAGLGSRIAAGAKTGGAYGGLAGLTEGEADLTRGEVAQALGEGLVGATVGSTLGGTLPAAGAGLRRLYQGVVQPTPAAQTLQQEGVKGLTLGQMTPRSTLGAYESAAQSNPIAGPILAGQRNAAVDSLRTVALKRGVAPGATPPSDDMTPPEAIAHLRKGFKAAYDEVRETKMPTLPVDRLLVAADDQNVIATEADRVAVGNFLRNQMSRLPPSGTETTAGVFMKIREKLRDEIVKASRSGSMERVALLERAEQELTDGLNNNLPDAAAQKLRATDAAYRNFKILQDAVGSAGDMAAGPGMFTPKGLSAAVERATGDTAYAELGGGPLRRLSAAAAQAFQETPKTGWGAALAGGPLGYAAAPIMALANRPGVQPFFLGQAPIQQSTARAVDVLSQYLNTPPYYTAAQTALEAFRNPRPQE